MTSRADNEIEHGKWLAENQAAAEDVWGWASPAGQLRAQRRAQLIVEGAALRPGMRALEVGCGTGMFTELFAASGADVVAVDISPDLLERARARKLPERVQFECIRFEDGGYVDEFDAAIGSSILHHLEVEPSLRVLFRALKPGGRLAFAEPNYLNPQVWAERRFRHWEMFKYTSPDETAFVRFPLAQMMKAAGFVDIRIEPFDWLHPHTPPPLIRWVRALGKVLESTPGAREFAGSLIISAAKPPART